MFADNFKLKKDDTETLNQPESEESNEPEATDDSGYYVEYTDGTGDETFDEDYDDVDNYSAIDIDTTPNVGAVAAQLSISERAKFDTSLATGQIQMYCR